MGKRNSRVLERAAIRTGAIDAQGQRPLYSLAGVLCAASLYSACHIGARLIASANLGEDDPLEEVLTQTLAFAYLPGRPPLYDWLLWLIGQITGPGALRFQLLKYGLLTATCGFIFLAARRVMKGDAFWAFLSVEALALIYQISWRFHEGFTHQVGAMCAVAATFWALLRVIEERRLRDFVFLGAAVGLGVLTVNAYWVFLAALVSAAILQPSIRRGVLRPGLAATLTVAALISGPYFVWLANTPDGLSAMLPTLAVGEAAAPAKLILASVRRAFTEPVMYLAPLIFIYPLFFPGMIPAVLRAARLRPSRAAEPDFDQLLLHMALLCIAALILGAVMFGIHHYATHALMPLFLVTSIWLTTQARRAVPGQAQMRRFVIAAAGVAVFAFFARAANMYIQEPVCSICRWGVPYAGLAEAMRRAGAPEAMLVRDWELGGNLRRFFPETPMAIVGKDAYAPPGFDASGRLTLVWDAADRGEKVLSLLRAVRPNSTAASLDAATAVEVPWRGHLWKPDGYRVSSWRVLVLPPQQAVKHSRLSH
jgi:hypothetical protein